MNPTNKEAKRQNKTITQARKTEENGTNKEPRIKRGVIMVKLKVVMNILLQENQPGTNKPFPGPPGPKGEQGAVDKTGVQGPQGAKGDRKGTRWNWTVWGKVCSLGKDHMS